MTDFLVVLNSRSVSLLYTDHTELTYRALGCRKSVNLSVGSG